MKEKKAKENYQEKKKQKKQTKKTPKQQQQQNPQQQNKKIQVWILTKVSKTFFRFSNTGGKSLHVFSFGSMKIWEI